MASLTLAQLTKQADQAAWKPIYLLHGEEAYFIDRAVALFEDKVLTEAEKSFNLTTLYGRDTDARTIIDTALRAPMMAPRQLVLVREAQQLRDLDKLLPYAQKPVPSTVLVLAYKHKKYPANRKLHKAINQHGAVLEGKRIREDQVANWIQDAVSQSAYRIDPKASLLLQTYLGADLGRVQGELEKLYLNLQEGETIKPSHIEKYIGISKEYNLFEWQNALLRGERSRAASIAAHFIAHPKQNPLVLLVGSLFTMFSRVYLAHFLADANDQELAGAIKVNPYFIRDYRKATQHYTIRRLERIFAYLQKADLRSKGLDNGSANHGDILKELTLQVAP